MTKEIYEKVKEYTEQKVNLSIINLLFIIDLMLLFYFKKSRKDYLVWNHIKYGSILSDIGMKLYSTNDFRIILGAMILGIIIIGVITDKTKFFNRLPSNDYSNNITIGYNPISAIYRLLYLIWHIVYEVWIVFFTILLLSGSNKINFNFSTIPDNQIANYLLLCFNTVVIIFLLIRSLFLTKFATRIQGQEINPYDSSRYIILNQKDFNLNKFFLIKDTMLDNPMFYFVKPQKQLSNLEEPCFRDKYYIADYSENFEEIKYEFESTND